MFTNEPLTDFSVEANRRALADALARLDDQLKRAPLKVAPIIAGREMHAGETYTRSDPSNPQVQVASVLLASPQMAEGAVQTLAGAARAWAQTSAEVRVQTIRKAAALMRQRRYEIIAIIIREAGKPWKEADADVAEGIDFCEYYCEDMLRLAVPQTTAEVPGEDNSYFYQPRGVVAVIAPWNFPFAIACGMTVAALVTGNTVALKPSKQSSLTAFELAKILLEGGVPAEAFAFVPGRGEVVGRNLVENREVAMICFTGSKAVGLEMIAKAAHTQPGQKQIKRVIAELGGKNAIIVDEDADLDEAIKGAVVSSFGYAGQKCSACSRIIAVGEIYNRFMERFCAAADDIIVGEAKDPASFMGPVIDLESKTRIEHMITAASQENKLALRGRAPAQGYFVPVTIFKDVSPTSSLWREEVFGPVVACRQAREFEEALTMANDSEYALTGGVFSRSPKNIERARHEFKVGNLYINRQCTGAMVCRQPFGGFRMSGIGSKAGGHDYLLQFMEPRTITENTMRRGFAPQ